MFEQQPELIRQKVKNLSSEFLEKSRPTEWFEVLYAESGGDASQIPWVRLSPHAQLKAVITDGISGEGKSALVIGCGLGDDAEALAACGFQVTAFDVAPSAIEWCRRRFPDSSVDYHVADVLALPAQWQHKFDLVFESRTIQALPLSLRTQVIHSIADCVVTSGTLFVITRFRSTDPEPDGPPWPVSETELSQFLQLGFEEKQRVLFFEDELQTIPQLRLEYIKKTH